MKTKKSPETLFYSKLAHTERNILDYASKGIMILLAASICAYLFNTKNVDKSDNYARSIQAGKYWSQQDLKAQYSFSVPKTKAELEKERNEVRRNIPLVFTQNDYAKDSATVILNTIFEYLALDETEQASRPIDINADILKEILNLKKKDKTRLINSMSHSLSTFINTLYLQGLIDISKEDIVDEVLVVHVPPKDDYYHKVESIVDRKKAADIFRQSIKAKYSNKYSDFLEYVFHEITIPNMLFNEELTQKSIKREIDNIATTKFVVHKNQVLVAKGTVIDAELNYCLSIYYNIHSNHELDDSQLRNTLGNIGHGLMLLLLVILYIAVLRKDIWNDNFQVFMILSFTVTTVFLAWITQRLNLSFPPEYLIVLPAFTLLITITIDARAAVIISLLNALMIAGIRNNDYILGTTYLIACGITAYSVRNITNLVQTFQSIIIILLGFSIPIVFFGFEIQAENEFLFRRVAASSINAIISPVLAFGLLALLDKFGFLWRFNTNLDLKAYDNKEHKLLRLMNDKAPGTYQHTLAVANLAEICALEIGANPMLTRVGSYYHDIGKILKPECFTENQIEGMQNKHNKLTPKQSALIIREHVTKGMELAKLYSLPKKISNFIPMHHGTSLIKHFYAKALEESEKVDDTFYRYHGPKPNSKETAILMICDGAEAISRISDMTIEQIENIIDQNIQEKILDGQFNESGITLGDLQKIKQIIAKTILGMMHQRTSYKQIPQKK